MKIERCDLEFLVYMQMALRDLIRKYKNEPMKYNYPPRTDTVVVFCPLCYLGYSGSKPNSNCKCPWIWFLDKTCMKGHYFYETIPKRLRRIRTWQNQLKTEITFRRANGE